MVERNYKDYPNPSHVISVEEAATILGSNDVIFVDTRNYWKYVDGHIPGAVNLEMFAFHWYDTSREGLETYAREMARLLGAYGINGRKRVIFYENESGYDAARGVWLLELLGSKKGRMLDGGLGEWTRKKGELSKSDPSIRRARFTPRLNLGVVCGLEELAQGLGPAGPQIVDARSEGEYDGTYTRALRGGHIPGARNIEWKKALRGDGSLKDASELLRLYGGLSRGRDVVTYCQSGYRAAHTWLVLTLLGFSRPRSYLGSWYEWGNSPKTRIVR